MTEYCRVGEHCWHYIERVDLDVCCECKLHREAEEVY